MVFDEIIIPSLTLAMSISSRFFRQMSAQSPKRSTSAFGNHQVMLPRSSHGYSGVCFKRHITDNSGQQSFKLTILAIG